MNKVLYTIYLKQDFANQSLLINAISQLIIKVLYSFEEELSFEKIHSEIKKILNSNINEDRVHECLEELRNESRINKTKDNYILRENYRKKLSAVFNLRKDRFNSAVKKYFEKSEVELEKINKWFEEINISFFCEYSSEWIEDLTGRSEKRRNYATVFKTLNDTKLYRKYEIPRKERSWFKEQYISFLRSNDPKDNLLMWDYANTMFASQLITTNLYSDKSIKDLFQYSKIILDTNILMYLDLEKDKYSQSYENLEKIFTKLDIEPIYFNITKREYNRAIDYKIDCMEKNLEKWELSTLSKSEDSFIKTAVNRGCTEKDHFNTFFKSIQDVPTYFNSTLQIKEYDNSEISEIITAGEHNKKLHNVLNDVHQRRYGKDKSENSLYHDAGLITGANHLREKKKTWILTRDGTVHIYSQENTKQGELPIAINLKTIINLLSVNDGGIDIEPDNIVPLFSNFIKNDVLYETNTFQLEDLTRMYEIQSKITLLPEREIISIAKEINHERFKGTDDKKIALILQRRIEKYNLEIKDKLKTTESNLITAKKQNDRNSEDNETRKNNYIKKRKKELLEKYSTERINKIIAFSIFQFAILLFISVGIIFLIKHKNSELDLLQSSLLAIGLNILTNILSIKSIIKVIFDKKYHKNTMNIEDEIDNEWDDLLK